MKVEDYEYIGNDEFEDDIELTDDRKEELIKKVKDQIVRGHIALHKILKIGENDEEFDYIYEWLAKNDITIRGINVTLSGELENYEYIEKLGEVELPPPLEEEEQQNLFLKLNEMKKNGVDTDSKEYQDIREKLIVHNMRLALWAVSVKYGKDFKDLGIEEDDLKQMALESLIKSIDSYDADIGYKFSTHAVPRVFYGVRKKWRKEENNSDSKRKDQKRLELFEEKMLRNLNRQPTDEEIKEALGISDISLETLKVYMNYHAKESLDDLNKVDDETIIRQLLDDERVVESDDGPIVNGTYIDTTEIYSETKEDAKKVDVAAEIQVCKEDLFKALDTSLTQREKKVLELRFGLKDGVARTLEEVGHYVNVSRTTVRKIEARALRKLRRLPTSRILKDYIEAIDNEEWIEYDEQENQNEIVDGIKIEGYDSQKRDPWKNVLFPQVKEEKELWGDEEKEQLEDEDIEIFEGQDISLEQKDESLKENEPKAQVSTEEGVEEYKKSLEKLTNMEENGKRPNYLDEISKLLTELDELDRMIRQTDKEIENEKHKKQKIRAKMEKVKATMQNQK